MDSRRKQTIKVLMFPWLAHGHITPFLELAKALAARNFTIFICSSRINLDTLHKSLSADLSSAVNLIELPIPATALLPPHLHTTALLPPHLMPHLKRALDSARPQFSSLLRSLRPDLLLYDFLQPWAPAEAALLNIPAAVFFSTGATPASLLAHQMFAPAGSENPFQTIHYRETDNAVLSGRVIRSTGDNDDQDHDQARVKECVERSPFIFIKTFRELEGKYIDYISELTQKKVIPVGALVPVYKEVGEHDPIIEWLDRKEDSSTIFASFGSEYFLSEDEVREIAYGLEMSNVSFVWALRHPEGEEDKRFPAGFPVGFSERGVVVQGWIPQRRILSHRSVGGFMSHCGWSSVMEGMFSGVGIVAVPMHLDQPMNARVVEEAGVGEEVARRRDGGIDREEVARVVKRVVVEGEEMRRRAAEIGRMMREKGEEEIDEVVVEMVRLCGEGEGLGFDVEREGSVKKLNVTENE